MKKILNIYLLEIVLLILVGLIPLLWYKPGYMGLGHDMGFPLSPLDYFKDRLFSWTDRVGAFGSNQTESLAAVSIHGLEALISLLGFSLIQTQQIAFIFWFILPGVTMYIFLRSLYPRKEDFVIRLSGSLFYMMNHYLLQGWMIAERTKFSIVAALPIVILLIINVIYKKGSILKSSIILSIVLFFLNGGGGIPLWGGLMAASLTAMVAVIILSPDVFLRKIRRALTFFLLCSMFLLVLNLYWIYPYAQSFYQNYTVRAGAAGGDVGAASWSAEISKNASFINIFKMQGIPDWYDNKDHPYANNFLNDYFLIILSVTFPIIGFAALWKSKNWSREEGAYKTTLLLVLLVGIPLTAGSHPPFGFIYDFALKNIPGFLIFRTPFFKFGMIVWFAYSCLIALGLKNILELAASERRYPRLIITGGLLLFVILLSIYNYPIFTGSFFNWSSKYSTMVKVPDYIFEAKEEIDKNKFSTRTLLLPPLDLRKKTDAYEWKYYSLSSVPSILNRKAFILNDVLLHDDEISVVDGVYEQIARNSKSSLLGFMGVDKAIVRNDFLPDRDMEYTPIVNVPSLENRGQFSGNKDLGRWEFLDIIDSSVLPLIYSPKVLANILVDVRDLTTALDFPQLPKLGDTFVLTSLASPASLEPEMASQYIVEAKCLDCNSTEINPLIPSSQRILPGSQFYFIVKFVQQIRLNSLNDPVQKVDFLLGTTAKSASAVDILIKDRRNSRIVDEIVSEWNGTLGRIKEYYQSIQGTEEKTQSGKRIYKYLWAIILRTQDWRFHDEDSPNIEKLESFEDLSKFLIKDLNLQPPPREDKNQAVNYKYALNIPKTGTYKIGVYGDLDAGVERKNDEDSERRPKPLLLVNNDSIPLTKVGSGEMWYQAQEIRLDSGEYFLSLPPFVVTKTQKVNDFRLNAFAARSGCADVNIDNINAKSQYRIKFKYKNASGRPLSVRMIEQGSYPLKTIQKKVAFNVSDVSVDNSSYGGEFGYVPGSLVKTAKIQFCIDSYYLSDTSGQVNSLEINETRPSPLVFGYSTDQFSEIPSTNLEFVALNQTKYLIRVDDTPTNAMVVLNSRHEDSWRMREVDQQEASKYFIGEQKRYLNGRVVEYERQDNHIITNLIFPQISDNMKQIDLLINGFAGAWNFPSGAPDKEGKRTFLLEYQVQNSVYPAAIASLSFLVLLTILFLINRHEKSN